MNPDILRGLLIEEMGRVRTDALLDRCQLLSGAASLRAEVDAQRARIRELEAEAQQRADEINPAAAPAAPHLPS